MPLKTGQILRSIRNDTTLVVSQLLGSGGQGEVYKAQYQHNNTAVAVKWYHDHYLALDPAQHGRLTRAIAKSNLAHDPAFLWPQDLVILGGTKQGTISQFGYAMPLRDPRLFSMFGLLHGHHPNVTMYVLLTACMQLAHAFGKVHAEGLAYRDISLGNVFFDPSTGDISICDNDNVDTNGAAGGIAGTPDFMAPEIVIGKAQPSTETDLFSLAVLLFLMLVRAHPLKHGKRELKHMVFDDAAMRKMCGEDPLFIFHPTDESNRPDPHEHPNACNMWPLLPTALQKLFVQTFVDGLHEPSRRTRESEWRKALLAARDSLYFHTCGAEVMYDAERLKQQNNDPGICYSCKDKLQLPMRMRIFDPQNPQVPPKMVILNHLTKLYPYHTARLPMHDFQTVVAELAQNPNNPQRWGLRNRSTHPWTAVFADGTQKQVGVGLTAPLQNGLKINFGEMWGEIRNG